MSSQIYGFKEQNKIGKSGESVVKEAILNYNRYTLKDVSNNPDYQNMDIDFKIIDNITGEEKTIEVKTDTFTSGNLAYETISNVELNTPGCMRKSKADILMYYFITWDKMYIFNLKELRKWCEDHLHLAVLKYANNYNHTTEFYAFYLKTLESKDFYLKVYTNFSEIGLVEPI